MHRYSKLLCVAACAAAVALPVAAQYAKPEDAVRYRQAALTVLNSHMGRINAQLKAPTPNMQTIQSSAGIVEVVSKLPWDAFGPNTEFVSNTKARPELFKNEAKFRDLADKMQAEAAKLNAVAKTGDAKAIRAQFNATGQSCDNCHDDFRSR